MEGSMGLIMESLAGHAKSLDFIEGTGEGLGRFHA